MALYSYGYGFDVDQLVDNMWRFDLRPLARLRPESFLHHGDEEAGRRLLKLGALMELAGLDPEARLWAVTLATGNMYRARLLSVLAHRKAVLTRGCRWYRGVRAFYLHHTVQRPGEADRGTLAVPDIPAAVPHLAARLWLEMSFEPSAQEFLSNPWAIQIHLDQVCTARWEMNMLNIIRPGEEEVSGDQQLEVGVEAERYDLYWQAELGVEAERYDLYWHWRSKAADNFRLLASDGSVFVGENGAGGVYTLNDLEDWIATKTNMVEIPNLVYLDII